jgi:hypothetical protein
MPAISTLRVDKSIKKRTRNRCSPLRVHSSTVKKSAATRPTRSSFSSAIVLLSDQFPVSSQQSLRPDEDGISARIFRPKPLAFAANRRR